MRDIAIIGSGPAGLTAAIYLARAGYKPVVYTGEVVGGNLTYATKVENYPGYNKGISGTDLMAKMLEQAEFFGTEIKVTSVSKVDSTNKGYHRVFDADNGWGDYKAVLIATGTVPTKLGAKNEDHLIEKGYIHFCATCDGWLYKEKDVAVIGGGETAMQYAEYLSGVCKHVYIIIRKDHSRADKSIVDRVSNISNVTFLYNTECTEFIGKDRLEGLAVTEKKSYNTQGCFGEEYYTLAVDGAFLALGHKSTSTIEYIGDMVCLDENKFICGTVASSGVFFAGDCGDTPFKQAVIAAGDGATEAMHMIQYLKGL